MKRTAAIVCTLLAVAVLTGPAWSKGTPKPEQQLQGLSWIAGQWKGQWGGDFSAYYTTPDGGKVLSHSELSRDGKVVFHEFEKFEVRDGAVTLTPYPGGRPAKSFRLKEANPKTRIMVFENPKKDFPTRIEYHCPKPDQLVVVLSDPHGTIGKTERIEMQRQKK